MPTLHGRKVEYDELGVAGAIHQGGRVLSQDKIDDPSPYQPRHNLRAKDDPSAEFQEYHQLTLYAGYFTRRQKGKNPKNIGSDPL